MRLTSEIWTSALIRRVFSEGGFGAVMRRGAAEAGAVFVVVRGRAGDAALFAPAPQAAYEEGRPSERRFMQLPLTAEAEVNARIEREVRFDPDLWVVEIEGTATPSDDLFPVTPA